MKESIAKEAREMAEQMRELLDASTPGPWAGVSGPDRRRDRNPRPGAIETEFASGKRSICEEVTGADKSFILYARNHFGRVAELLDMLADQAGGTPSPVAPSAAAPTSAPAPSAVPSTPTTPPSEIDAGEHMSGDGFEIDLSGLEGTDANEIAETLKQLEGGDEKK